MQRKDVQQKKELNLMGYCMEQLNHTNVLQQKPVLFVVVLVLVLRVMVIKESFALFVMEKYNVWRAKELESIHADTAEELGRVQIVEETER